MPQSSHEARLPLHLSPSTSQIPLGGGGEGEGGGGEGGGEGGGGEGGGGVHEVCVHTIELS